MEPRCDELDENRRATDKSAVMRLANLSHDRPELAFATKEIARSMQTPDEASWMAWKQIDSAWERLVLSGGLRNKHL